MSEPILVLNCGSSSIKFALFDPGAEALPRTPSWSGSVEGIGGGAASFVSSDAAPAAVALDPARPYPAALQVVRERVQAHTRGRLPAAIVHRVVHGGEAYVDPVRIDRRVLDDLKGFIPLAPLHQPYALQAIELLLDELPGLPQLACFDTAFHHTLPLVEQVLPLPHAYRERGIRRYGFHGLSYEYQSIALAEGHGDAARGRTIVAHLGSGASLCAMQGLSSVATTMGFSALDGLMMGTRCGALDPGVLLYLMEVEGFDPKRLSRLLYRESGLLGVSGRSASVKELLAAEADDPRVRLALDLYVRRIVREIGALTAVLGGLDLLAFTAGVGERSPEMRRRICDALGWLGVRLDDDANRACTGQGAATLSTDTAAVRVVVEPTNEEWVAATAALQLLRPGPADAAPGRRPASRSTA